jgi:hypothetical protein
MNHFLRNRHYQMLTKAVNWATENEKEIVSKNQKIVNKNQIIYLKLQIVSITDASI